MIAAMKGQEESATLLLQCGADSSMKCSFGLYFGKVLFLFRFSTTLGKEESQPCFFKQTASEIAKEELHDHLAEIIKNWVHIILFFFEISFFHSFV